MRQLGIRGPCHHEIAALNEGGGKAWMRGDGRRLLLRAHGLLRFMLATAEHDSGIGPALSGWWGRSRRGLRECPKGSLKGSEAGLNASPLLGAWSHAQWRGGRLLGGLWGGIAPGLRCGLK